MTEKKETEYWRTRARSYNNLEWAKREEYLQAFIRAGDFQKTDVILDVGTGTGIVAHALAPLVRQVIGLDMSQDMLRSSNWNGNKYFVLRDIREPFFHDGVFDKVTARMVFHHILERSDEAMAECHRVLKRGGKMILSEGVPPCREVKEDYTRIFRLKEERVTFLEDDLHALLGRAGFINVQLQTVVLKHMSVRNWLANSGLPEETQEEIFRMHADAMPYFKKAYDMIETDNDCMIDMKMAILVGEKGSQ